MQRFHNILFIAEPIEKALPAFHRAVHLAQHNNASLTIMNFRQELPITLMTLDKTVIQLQQDQLKSLVEQSKAQELSIKTVTLTGTPFLEIINAVLSNEHDLVIKPAGDKEGIKNILFGSTDMHLMRKCPCPVWVIKPSVKNRYKNILAAVNPDSEEGNNAELNDSILKLAISLAQQDRSQLHIVHSWEMPYEDEFLSANSGIPKHEAKELIHGIKLHHKDTFDELLGNHELSGLSIKTHLKKGDPAKVILDLSKEHKVDLIIMGTVAKTGIPGFFIGNTAEKVLNSIDSSVLAIKPKSFSTPVEKRA
ncbi:MAG: universal stress protein [Gammaproteobacteria bacterium]|nr:universal stress protein [Gammaproteobacteria bacterium]